MCVVFSYYRNIRKYGWLRYHIFKTIIFRFNWKYEIITTGYTFLPILCRQVTCKLGISKMMLTYLSVGYRYRMRSCSEQNQHISDIIAGIV